MGKVTLDEDQFNKLTDTITANILEAQGSKEPTNKNTPPVKGEPNAFSASDVASEVMKMMKSNDLTDANKVYETLWKDKYSSTVNNVQGLDDFIKGEDDYGNIREEQLNKIENYEDRVSALGKLTTSFKEASAGQSGKRPIVNTKLDKKIQKAESNYDAVKEKLNKGEYTSTSELAQDYFAAISDEMATLM